MDVYTEHYAGRAKVRQNVTARLNPTKTLQELGN